VGSRLEKFERKILWYYFFKRRLRKSFVDTLNKTWELVTKHFMKILIIAFLTWLSVYGIKYFQGIFEKLNVKDLIETVKESE
jgi:hypothetical protein